MAGSFIRHISCDACGSSDANALYINEDGTHSTNCFSCDVSKQKVDPNGLPQELENTSNNNNNNFSKGSPMKNQLTVEEIQEYPMTGLRERGLVKNLAEFYGLRTAKKSEADTITHHYYPYHKGGKVVGYQERTVETKSFRGIGHAKADIELQGQHLWPNGGNRTLVITEGFLDCLAASQMLSGKSADAKRFPVVSLPAGANSKSVLKNIDWVNSFDKVILMLDQDEVGDKCAKEIAMMLRPGKAYLSKFSEKDASDMLINGKDEEFKQAYWNAQKYSPADIVTAADARSILSKENDVDSLPFPDFAAELNMVEYGKRKGEITCFTSGTGMGKSQFLREDVYQTMLLGDTKVGIVSLEESTRDILKGMQSLYLNKRITLPDVDVSEKEIEDSLNWLVTTCGDNLVMLDHQGSSMGDDLMDKVRYLIAIGCEYIYVDHITIAVSGESDQNSAIDNFMEQLLKLCKQHLVWFGVVSHLRKTGGEKKSFESGGVPTDDDLKGSGSIKQIAFTIIALVRNKMAKEEKDRNKTKLYILKSRYTGRTGYAGQFTFDSKTGRLLPVDDGINDVSAPTTPDAPTGIPAFDPTGDDEGFEFN